MDPAALQATRGWREMFASLAVVGISLCILSGGAACSKRGGAHPEPESAFETIRSRARNQVAAVVNGHPLGAAEFRTYWRERPGSDRGRVVDAVVGRELAVQRGMDEGRHRNSELSFVRKRAMIRALLRREVERVVTVDTLDQEAIERAESRLHRRLGRPSGIRASHVLVMAGERSSANKGEAIGSAEDREVAREWAARLRAHLSEKPTLAELFALRDRYADEVPEPLQLAVNINLTFPHPEAREFDGDLPSGWMEVVEPFARAAASLAGRGKLGAVSDPVESRFGWHLVVPTERLPAKVPEAEPLRELAVSRALRAKRSERFAGLLEKWASGVPVATFPEAFDESAASGGE